MRSASRTAPTRSSSPWRRSRSGAGDEVICPAFTFYATAEAIARAGATPVFADIDPVTLNLDPDDVAARITPRTKAIMAVHLFGRPAPLAELAALGLPVIEDAAQAFGADGVAATGICSTFSFFPTKNLFALGDGGLVTCLDDGVAERVRMLRFHGSRDKTTFELVGTNSRLDAVQAAMLRVFLPRLTAGMPPAARRRHGTRSSVSARPWSFPPTSLATCTTCTSSVLRDAVTSHRLLRRRNRVRVVLRHAASPAAGARLPRIRARLASRDRADGRGEPRSADVGLHRRRGAGARGRGRACGRRRPGLTVRSPSTGTALAGRRRRGADRGGLGARPGTCASTATAPRYYDRYLEWDVDRRSSSGSCSPSSSPSASTTAGGATCRRGTCGAPSEVSRLR